MLGIEKEYNGKATDLPFPLSGDGILVKLSFKFKSC